MHESRVPVFTAGDRRQILCQLTHANDLMGGPALLAWLDSVAVERYELDQEAGTALDVLYPLLPLAILDAGVEQAQAMMETWHRACPPAAQAWRASE